MLPIKREDHNLGDISAELEQRLRAFNEAAAGPLHRKPVALTIRDDSKALLGGLVGEIFWNAVYIQHLWVDEAHRGQGYGAALLQEMEDAARSASCEVSYLSTFDFQAPRFYEEHGYTVVGVLQNVPRGSRRRWFCKMLGPAAI
jgi:GNAT superfamily N-acetyltransferase